MKKTLAILLTVLLIISVGVTSVFAGNGDGSGGGSSDPLTLDDIVVESESIVLTFSKNVVNMKVKDNNMTCFELKDANGNDVAFEVEMGDDQVDPDCKRIITIKPTEALDLTNEYTLTIKADLTSKSGVAFGEDTDIVLPVENDADDLANTDTNTPTDTETPQEQKQTSPLLYVVIAAIVVIAVIVILKKKK